MPRDAKDLPAVVSHRQEGSEHQVISSNHAETLRGLKTQGAENISEAHMSIEDIALHILKRGRHA